MNLGMIKNKFNRLSSYLSIVNFVLLLLTVVKTFEVDPIHFAYIVVGVTCLIIMLSAIDTLVVMPQEQDYISKKNPVIKEMSRKVDELHKKTCREETK